MGFLKKLKFRRRNLKFWSKKGPKVTPVEEPEEEKMVEDSIVESEEMNILNEEPIKKAAITLEATPVEEESVFEQVDSEESKNEEPIIITLEATPVEEESVFEQVDSEESKNEEPIIITLEVTPVEEPEEEKMVEDSIVESEEMNILNEEPIKKAAITLEATPVEEESVFEQVDSEESKNEEPIIITLEVTPVEEPEEEKMVEDSIVESEEMNILNEEPIKKAAITLEATPVEEPEEEKMVEDSVVESEEMNIFNEEHIKKAANTLEEEFNQLRTLVATQNVELQKIHDEMDKVLKQIYKREHKPVCSMWKKLCLVVGGAVLGFAGVVLMHYLPIEVDLDVDFTIKYIG